MRRYHALRFDIWLCLLLGYLVSLGTVKLAEAYFLPAAYEAHVEEHTVADGEIGGMAGANAFQAQNVEDLLSHDTFTVVSPGIEYRNRGGGYYGSGYMQALTLPSGELVAALINMDSVEVIGDYYTGESIMPLGQVVWEDLTENESFLNQIQFKEPLSRTDFYIDMMGNGGTMSEETFSEVPTTMVQLLTIIVCFPIFHALGASMGIFPYFFAPKNKKKSEWE